MTYPVVYRKYNEIIRKVCGTMIVAFLDLLGFSALLRTNIEVALDNMNSFNNVIKTRVIDNKYYPIEKCKDNYPNDVEFHKFVEKSSVTAFEQMISFSDSLVLGGTNYDMFIKQLTNFISSVYIEYSEPFNRTFSDIHIVTTHKVAEGYKDGSIRYHNAFPILFRGGIAVGDSVGFFDEYHIKNSELKLSSLNVMGTTYLNAVKLEASRKGPRLFCDKSVVDIVNDETKKLIKLVDEEKSLYEIVWTIEGCQATGCCASNKWENVVDRIHDKMLPSAIKLYQYYRNDKCLEPQYKELLKLVCEGIVKYAQDECNRANDVIDYINSILEKKQIPLINISILNGFLA